MTGTVLSKAKSGFLVALAVAAGMVGAVQSAHVDETSDKFYGKDHTAAPIDPFYGTTRSGQ